MSLDSYLMFVAASLIVVMIPGPSVMLVVSQALSSGKGSVTPLAAGVGLGDLVAMTLSFLGLGAILAASALTFTILKWVGALYLAYLGVKMFRASSSLTAEDGQVADASGRSQFISAFITTALNPKSIIFFIAFVPQFVSTEAALVPQFFILGATFLVLGVLNAAMYALFAGKLRSMLRNPKALQRFNRVGGSLLVGAGVLTAATRHG
ncbi:putative threonine efflux protein [Hahella chejuensis KCTC 2396]|uniref:Putative threonine efflux protein n=1 Tax=Hahella chejuensis (strain KCTC 2396) TaxID=349521 RepID=Q2SPU0_HAHCH|nr:LysE family translocator [Hahella chejuensis]ABC27334.1 putative threonine efflux protein [Hahella chejuensis KCTC 2396]